MQGVRVPPDMLSEIEVWREQHQDQPTRAEAMRMLIRAGLDAEKTR